MLSGVLAKRSAMREFGAENDLVAVEQVARPGVPSTLGSPVWEFRYSSDTVDRSQMIASPAGIPAARCPVAGEAGFVEILVLLAQGP